MIDLKCRKNKAKIAVFWNKLLNFCVSQMRICLIGNILVLRLEILILIYIIFINYSINNILCSDKYPPIYHTNTGFGLQNYIYF